jgi:hypothetical protein
MNNDKEIMNNDNEVVARLIVHNVGDGVQIMLVWTGGAVKTLAYVSGVNVTKAVNTALKRRAGGRVAEVKK